MPWWSTWQHRELEVAMFFTGFYSLTFLVGTFLLPDFDRPSSPSAGDGTAPPTDAK